MNPKANKTLMAVDIAAAATFGFFAAGQFGSGDALMGMGMAGIATHCALSMAHELSGKCERAFDIARGSAMTLSSAFVGASQYNQNHVGATALFTAFALGCGAFTAHDIYLAAKAPKPS